MIPTPIELLQKQLIDLEHSLKKSKKSFFEDMSIDENVHQAHVKNLEPKIEEYKDAINVLKHINKFEIS